MAGAGYKLFNTGDVLLASEVNTYLQQQTVMVFASSTARTTALSGVLAEGMMSYLQDTNSVEVYNGSSWVNVGNAGDITGVTAGTGISGGGTTGDVTITNLMATAIDAKGDLIVGTGADTFSRLAVGTNDYVLTAASGEATGLKWAAAGAAENYSLINTGGTALTGAATITVSGISGKNSLFILIVGGSSANASAAFEFRLNADTGSNYYAVGWSQTTIPITVSSYPGTTYPLATMSNNSNSVIRGGIRIDGCNSAGVKMINAITSCNNPSSSTGQEAQASFGYYDSASTISSVSIISNSGNFDAGTVYIYGA